MTSRERVLAALDHREPDRVPIDLGGNQTGIHKFAYEALIEHLGLDEEIEIMDAVQQLARPSEAVLERLRVDTRYIHAGAAADFDGTIVTAERDGRRWHDLTDEFGVRWSMPDDSPLYMDITHHPLADATIDDLADYPFPRGRRPGPVRRAARAGAASSATRRPTPWSAVSAAWSTRSAGTCAGWSSGSCDMLEQPEFCEALLDRTLQVLAGLVRRFPERSRRRGRRDHDRRRPGRPERAAVPARTSTAAWSSRATSNWCSTSSRAPTRRSGTTPAAPAASYIPDLLDNGIDALNPVQISAADMDPAQLKAEFGDRLVFWGGGIDAQHVLPARRSGDGPRARAAEHRSIQAGRRLRVQQRPQHPGRRAGREHPGHVRCGLRVRRLPPRNQVTPLPTFLIFRRPACPGGNTTV